MSQTRRSPLVMRQSRPEPRPGTDRFSAELVPDTSDAGTLPPHDQMPAPAAPSARAAATARPTDLPTRRSNDRDMRSPLLWMTRAPPLHARESHARRNDA